LWWPRWSTSWRAPGELARVVVMLSGAVGSWVEHDAAVAAAWAAPGVNAVEDRIVMEY
jgi:osmotically-inducible protein OsmY